MSWWFLPFFVVLHPWYHTTGSLCDEDGETTYPCVLSEYLPALQVTKVTYISPTVK